MLGDAERGDSSSFSTKSSAMAAQDAMSDDLKETLLREVGFWKMKNRRLLDEIVAREMPQREALVEKVRQELRFYRSTTAERAFHSGMMSNPVLDSFNDEGNCDWKIHPDLIRKFACSVDEERVQDLRLPALDNERRAEIPSSGIDFRPGYQVQTSPKTSGIKRKIEDQSSVNISDKPKDYDNPRRNENAGRRKSFPAKKTKPDRPSQNWSCAICKINTSSEINLRSHLQGRIHKSNLKYHKPYGPIKTLADRLETISSPGREISGGNSVRIGSTNPDKKDDDSSAPLATASPDRSDRVSSKPVKKPAVAGTETRSSDGEANKTEAMASSVNGMRLKMLVDGVMHEVVQAGGFLWCELCRLKFNGAAMMANHLAGASHVAALSASLTSHPCV